MDITLINQIIIVFLLIISIFFIMFCLNKVTSNKNTVSIKHVVDEYELLSYPVIHEYINAYVRNKTENCKHMLPENFCDGYYKEKWSRFCQNFIIYWRRY